MIFNFYSTSIGSKIINEFENKLNSDRFLSLVRSGVDNMDLFRKESLASYMKTDGQMPKTMNAGDLMAMGIGAVIGSGIFILPGTVAANDAGPGVTLSFWPPR